MQWGSHPYDRHFGDHARNPTGNLNVEVFAFCEREQIPFTSGRAYREHDQCYVEQKNGAEVRCFPPLASTVSDLL